MTTANEGSSKPNFLDLKLNFKGRVERLFVQLTERKLSSNQAAAYSLKLASSQVDSLIDPADVLAVAKAGKVEQRTCDDSDKYSALTTLFSSRYVLAISFGVANPSPSEKAAEDPQCALEVDFERVDEVFKAIVGSENGALVDELAEGCHALAESLENAPSDLVTVHTACILLQNPLFEDPEYEWMLTHLFDTIGGWEDKQKRKFSSMLQSYPKERFQGLVQKTQQVITLSILDGKLNAKLKTALQFMKRLFNVNLKTRLLPISEFYNDAVNDEEFLAENLKKDWMVWSNGSSRSTRMLSLCSFPFVYEPAAKSTILSLSNFNTQMSEFHDALRESISWGGGAVPFLVLRVRRGEHLVHDTLLQIQNAGSAIRRPLKVQFIGEEGVDEGGVQKEFFQLLMRELFDANFGMFRMDPDLRTFWFRASSLDLDMEFELVGLLLALAIYNNHILDISFPQVVYKLLMGRDVGLEDLKDVHPDVYQSLKKLLAYEGDIADLGLVFQVEQEADFGEPNIIVDLIPDGGQEEVTADNRQQYVDAYVQHLLIKSVSRQNKAFCKGFRKLWIKQDIVFKLFQPEELECLICGSTELDFDALESAVLYESGFSVDSQVVTWFWEVVHGFSEEQKKRLLFFVTGSDRVPIKGLASLQPPFVIARNGPSSNRLPTAHTCFNHLLLPAYNDKATLQNRLETAINNAEGFGLR
ncbi:probable E3 ubiquitin-protein ligase HECTD2 [Coccomyxa sp. Obi]|nr:probable E3 ubiquitin-protein ligase HECTD2 [Coccomyxa sp. Obi]